MAEEELVEEKNIRSPNSMLSIIQQIQLELKEINKSLNHGGLEDLILDIDRYYVTAKKQAAPTSKWNTQENLVVAMAREGIARGEIKWFRDGQKLIARGTHPKTREAVESSLAFE